jgi:uncharacterized membrane protein YphA (DoxX/SURF4 family)
MSTSTSKKSKTLHVLLWTAQALLAGMFLMVGFMKLATPIVTLSKTVPLAGDVPLLVRFIGLSEVLGGFGLLLPAALRIKPHLTILAAIGLAIVMLLALIYHLAKGEVSAIGSNIVLGALAVFVAWGRARKVPITPREIESSFKLN